MTQQQRRSTGYVPGPHGYPPPPVRQVPNEGYGHPYTGGYQPNGNFEQPHSPVGGAPSYPPAYGGYGSYDAPQQPAPIQAGREHYVDDRMYNGANYRGH